LCFSNVPLSANTPEGPTVCNDNIFVLPLDELFSSIQEEVVGEDTIPPSPTESGAELQFQHNKNATVSESDGDKENSGMTSAILSSDGYDIHMESQS
jgi:hypothetical protein